MAKAAYSKVFVTGSKRVTKTKRIIVSEPIEPSKGSTEAVEVKRGKKREARFQAAVQKGDIIKSDLSVSDLQDKKHFPTLVTSFLDCLNEAELRSKFPKNGIGHNFFMGGHKLKFYVANDNTSTVAQVLKL